MSNIYVRLASFFALACAFTWVGILGNVLWPSEYWPQMNPLGPIIAAPIFILAVQGRTGLRAWWRRVCTLRAPAWVYVVAILGPLSVILISVWTTGMAGQPLGPLPEYGWLEVVILVPIILLAGPGPEELSFRGYAQHEFQQSLSPAFVALLIGLGVVVWHLPLLASGELLWPWAVCIVAVSFVYAWLMNKGRSPWPAVTVHFVVNLAGGQFFGQMVATPEGQLLYAQIYAGLYVLWAVAIVLIGGLSLGRERPGAPLGLIRRARPAA